MTGISTLQMVARLCGDHIEDIGDAVLIVDIPLRGIPIIRRWRHDVSRLLCTK
jgi:hypothetical protein